MFSRVNKNKKNTVSLSKYLQNVVFITTLMDFDYRS